MISRKKFSPFPEALTWGTAKSLLLELSHLMRAKYSVDCCINSELEILRSYSSKSWISDKINFFKVDFLMGLKEQNDDILMQVSKKGAKRWVDMNIQYYANLWAYYMGQKLVSYRRFYSRLSTLDIVFDIRTRTTAHLKNLAHDL